MREPGTSFLQACLLLLIGERPAHGYDLVERLASFGLEHCDAASAYRALRVLERDGTVRSHWTPSECGPARRTYELTSAGQRMLAACADALRHDRSQAELYLRRHAAWLARATGP